MASHINNTCQCMARSSLRATRWSTQQLWTSTRQYATANKDQNVPRSQEMEELPPTLKLEEMSSLAHLELEAHRELRQLARTAVWEMPLLSALAKPFEPPTSATPLRWRYTTYLGEMHPASRKVVVEFSLRDLKDLSDEEKQTMRKLAGARWDPDTDIMKMSCESFETQAQNKRYLGETIATLIKEAKDGADKFADVPLDLRHAATRAKKRLRRSPRVSFPVEWRMTPERRAALYGLPGRLPQPAKAPTPQIEAQGTPTQEQAIQAVKQAAIAAGELEADDEAMSHIAARNRPVVSGIDVIEASRKAESQKISEAVTVEAQRPPPGGKMGRR